MKTFVMLACAGGCLVSAAWGGVDLGVVSIAPARLETTAPANARIEIVFDRPVDVQSLTATAHRFHVFGERSGSISGTLSLLDGGTRVRFTPDALYARGERVSVVLADAVSGVDASTLGQGGYSWQFWVRAGQATMQFQQIGTLDTGQAGVSPRPYGGSACDLNKDGWVDLSIVNEDTSDVRVFMNRADATGLFDPFLQPTHATGPVPSPNEAADFDGDANVDLCTANTSGASVSVLLGQGDGTFAAGSSYPCGANPRGIAVLDADGDGDLDIATANTGSNNVALLLNNGAGVFGPPSVVVAGFGGGDWALNAADMNNDGIMDLVLGRRFSGEISVHLGQGDATFSPAGSLITGLGYWMIVCADMNADGNMDVTAAAQGSSAIHFGDGAGGIGLPQVFGAITAIATDTGDLDGDGDLDWVISDFSAGQWSVYKNNGLGSFSLDQTLPAGSNCACALIVDIDNDTDLDLALIDEITDLIYIRRNASVPPACFGDVTGDRVVNITDVSYVIFRLGDFGPPGSVDGDADANGVVDVSDIAYVVFRLGGAC